MNSKDVGKLKVPALLILALVTEYLAHSSWGLLSPAQYPGPFKPVPPPPAPGTSEMRI